MARKKDFDDALELEEGFVRRKMLINGIEADMIVPINSLEKVKHLIIK